MTQITIRVNDQIEIQTLQNLEEMTTFASEKELIHEEVVPFVLKFTTAVSEVMENLSLFYHLVRRSHDWGYDVPSNLDFKGLLESKAVQKVIQISTTIFSKGEVTLRHGAMINRALYNRTLADLKLIRMDGGQLFLNLAHLLHTSGFKLQRGVGPKLADLGLINDNEKINEMAKNILLSDTKMEENTIRISSPLAQPN